MMSRLPRHLEPSGDPAAARTGRLAVPAGWPDAVAPPGTPDWQASATSWLLDCCPADYRGYVLLRRHPVMLARFAAAFVDSEIRGTRVALSQVRTSLGEYVPGEVIDAAVRVLQAEEARLTRSRRGVGLVEEALRGKVFVPQLG